VGRGHSKHALTRYDVERVAVPATGEIEAGDGQLSIHRGGPMREVFIGGASTWPGEVRCIHADGSVTVQAHEVTASWGGSDYMGGSFIGSRFAGATTRATTPGSLTYEWALEALPSPCPAPGATRRRKAAGRPRFRR
jgi:hypothetical protein